MKKLLSFLLCLAILCSVTIPVLGETETTPTDYESLFRRGCKTMDAASPIGGSEDILKTCDAAFLYECNSETLVYARNPDLAITPGSLIKIMTCIILGEGDTSEEVLVRQHVLDQVPKDVISIDLKDGEIISIEQLIYAIMVESANDAVAVGAYAKSGSIQAFVNLMNQRAQEIGCTNTHFGNPYGFEDGQTYSSARDLAKITRVAMNIPVVWDAYCSSFHDIPATNLSDVRELTTNNYMIFSNSMFNYYDPSIRGGKMGNSSGDHWHAVINSEQEGMHFIVVTLNGLNTSHRYNGATLVFGNLQDARIVLDYGYEVFNASQAVCAGQAISQHPVVNGANDVVLGAAEPIQAVLPANMSSSEIRHVISMDESLLRAPLPAGLKVGTLECWYRNYCVGVTDVVTLAPVELSTATVPLEGVSGSTSNDPGTVPKSKFHTALEVLGAIFLIGLVLFAVFTARVMIVRSRRQREKQKKRGYNERGYR